MGRHNHENDVAIPGIRRPRRPLRRRHVHERATDRRARSTDRNPATPGSGAGTVAALLYIAPDTDSLLNDEGDLWAFVSDTPGVKNYYDVAPGSASPVTGHFIKVPKNIATGHTSDGSELKAADVGYPLPPANGSWQRDLRSVTSVGIDGRSGCSSTGVTSTTCSSSSASRTSRTTRRTTTSSTSSTRKGPDCGTAHCEPGYAVPIDERPRLEDGARPGATPTVVTSLTVLVEGDDNPVKTLNEIHQPDNIESTPTGPPRDRGPGIKSAVRSHRYERQRDHGAALARPLHGVTAGRGEDRSIGRRRRDRCRSASHSRRVDRESGAWETTGIVDASAAFGPGAFLINVQAHTPSGSKGAG